MIAQIIPLLKLPTNLDIFSYLVPLELQKKVAVGQIVAVDFGHKKINGLIVNLETKKTRFYFKLKSIIKIITPLPIITLEQIELINFVGKITGASLTTLAKTLVPKISEKNPKFEIPASPAGRRNPKKNLKSENNKNRAKGKGQRAKEKAGKQLFWYQDIMEVEKIIKNKCKLSLKNKEQILILVPEISLIEKIIKNCALAEKELAIVHSKIKKSEHFQIWQDILSGKTKIIIGTKIAVFLPFLNLKQIIILNSEDWNHKNSEANPRFDARDVVEWLAENFGAELVLSTSAPGVEQVSEYQSLPTGEAGVRVSNKNNKNLSVEHSWDLRSDGLRGSAGGDDKITIINLKDERTGGNYSPISDKLLEAIKEKIKRQEKVFLFHNRIGFAKVVQCKDCEYIFKCPKCANNLAYENKKKQLVCSLCKYYEDMPPFCPKCSGAEIKFKNAGVQKVKSELQKLLPETKILELDKTEHKLTDDFQIIIGTRFVINKIDLKKFSLIAFINFDQLLNIGDFRAEEKAYQLFYNIFSENIKADFILQTNTPENFVLQSIKENKSEIFYEHELQTRKDFNYPPFSHLVKFIASDKKELVAKNSLKKITENLKNIDEKIEILGPLLDSRQGKNFKFNLIAKIPLEINLEKILNDLPKNVMLDVNPERIN